jgi:signal transduction histidine kinase
VEPIVIKTQWNAATGRVRLSVADHGAGFAAPILKRAFEPYVTTKSKGTGLGLFLCKKIADFHDANIKISNHIPSGSVFTITFPIR